MYMAIRCIRYVLILYNIHSTTYAGESTFSNCLSCVYAKKHRYVYAVYAAIVLCMYVYISIRTYIHA